MKEIITKIANRLEDLCMECFDEIKDIYGKIDPRVFKVAAVVGASVFVFAVGAIVWVAAGGTVKDTPTMAPVSTIVDNENKKGEGAEIDEVSGGTVAVPGGVLLPSGEFVPTTEETNANTTPRATIPVVPVTDAITEEISGTQPPEETPTQPPETNEAISNDSFVTIQLNGNSATSNKIASGATALIEDSRVTIEYSGDYLIRGTLNDGIIIVAATGNVNITLENVTVTNSIGPALRATRDMEAFTLTINNVGNNRLTDARPFVDRGVDPPELPDGDDLPVNRNGAIYSHAGNLVITGGGTLHAQGGLRHGIHSRNMLTIDGANVTANAPVHGLRSRIQTFINNSNINLTTGSKGIRAAGNNNGFITINNSNITVNSIRDGMHAEQNIHLTNTTYTATVNGGWRAGRQEDTMKGLRSDANIQIDGGTITINSAEDSMSASGTITINNASVTLETSRRAIRGLYGVHITNTRLNVEICAIGLRGLDVFINHESLSGVHIHAKDKNYQIGITSDDVLGTPAQEGSTNLSKDQLDPETRARIFSKCEGCH
ncbi:MAG: carbohydrate-binding domain-containing protein [Oscillospiraceae bacterium]|nr:carbohydrate-binding domain-containing protein [Oscillospiraceae bacterium]